MGLEVPATRNQQKFKKVPLTAGHSALDWARISSGSTGPRTNRRVTKEELEQHRTESDIWIVLGKKVYDVTEYVSFHPGGVQALIEVAGTDATELFMEYHPWVNYDSLLRKCFVGIYLD